MKDTDLGKVARYLDGGPVIQRLLSCRRRRLPSLIPRPDQQIPTANGGIE
jgi:hypothetical protein